MSTHVFTQFWQFAERYASFSPSEKRLVENCLVLRQVPKQYPLVSIGAVSKEIYFIAKGSLRLYYLTKAGEDITGFLFLENMFAGSLESFFSQVPSIQQVETLEDCELLALSHDHLEKLYWEVPTMNVLVRRLLADRLSYAQRVVASFILKKPEERYLALLEHYPQLLERVPQHMLSTYLGITPVSLSRIRRRIAQHKK